MVDITLNFSFPIESLNTSLQVKDTIYYVPTSNPTSFVTHDVGSLNNVQELGVLTQINETADGFSLVVNSNLTTTIPLDYIMFAKDKLANTTSLAGYYAKAKFVNNSKEKAELFSVGSEITESSK
jgi:hypothetical protein